MIQISDLSITLVRAPEEGNDGTPTDVLKELANIEAGEAEIKAAKRNPSIPSVPEWMITVLASSAAVTVTTALIQGISSWVNARNGRRFRMKIGDKEFEAPSIKDMEKLIRLSKDQEVEIRIILPGKHR